MEQEQKLIRAIVRRGSKQAADALVRIYYDEIYAYVYRQTGNREDALDLTQDCFIAALRSLHTYDPHKAGFRTWLYHVASHKIIDQRRKRQIECLPCTEWEDMPGSDFTMEVLDRELRQQVEAFVCGFDAAVQEVFRLRVYGDYRFPEIAAAMGESEAKIKAQYYRLVERLREEFGGYEGE